MHLKVGFIAGLVYYLLMTIKKKISIALLTLVCAVMMLFAAEIFMMANGGELFPAMEENIGKTSEELREFSPNLIAVLFTPVKALAALLLSLCVGILILVYAPFRRGEKWATLCIFSMLFLWLVPAFFIYYAQPNAPWLLWLILLLLVCIALGLELMEKKVS